MANFINLPPMMQPVPPEPEETADKRLLWKSESIVQLPTNDNTIQSSFNQEQVKDTFKKVIARRDPNLPISKK